MSKAKKEHGGQPANVNARKHGAYASTCGMKLQWMPESHKTQYPGIREFYQATWVAAEKRWGKPLPVHVEELVNSIAMTHSRVVLVSAYVKREGDSLTVDQLSGYIGLADRLTQTRHKLMHELQLGDDTPIDPITRATQGLRRGDDAEVPLC